MDQAEFAYYNRDISWLLFNRRVINQARDESIPLFERLRFLAIASSNLDEYYSVRIPSIQGVLKAAPHILDEKTGLLQRDIRDKICERNKKNVELQYDNLETLLQQIAEKDIFVFDKYKDLSEEEKIRLDEYFESVIFPCLTTIQFNQYHAEPSYIDGELNIYIRSKFEDEEIVSVIPISDKLSRTIPLSEENHYIFLEDLILNNLDKILPDNEIISKFVFRITRDKDTEIENDYENDLLLSVKKSVEDREKGHATRLEYQLAEDHNIISDLQRLQGNLDIDDKSSYNIPGPLDLTFLFKFIKYYASKFKDYVYKPFRPIKPDENINLFERLGEEDILLHHPYESFDYIVRFLKEAVDDPDTIAIKQTIYRVADDSEIVEQLVKAAKKGIQVTVVIELQARFDEENNIALVDRLQDAGCYVSYGKEDLKTHSKALLIVKNDGENTKSYVHLGTGNYNEDTSKMYTDLTLLSSDEAYVSDVEKFFNYLVNDIDVPEYERISTSPTQLKKMLLENIRRMKEHYQKTGKGKIFFKTNALTDTHIIGALYDAAEVGVPIRLIIRGACCMQLNICGPRENIEITSIVGRMLEHSRIYGFYWNDDDISQADFWIASADLMTRNMEDRVEIATPIIDPKLKEKLSHIIDVFTGDTKDAYKFTKDGKYEKFDLDEKVSAQEKFISEVEDFANSKYGYQQVKETKKKTPKNKKSDKGNSDYLYGVVIVLLLITIALLTLNLIY